MLSKTVKYYFCCRQKGGLVEVGTPDELLDKKAEKKGKVEVRQRIRKQKLELDLERCGIMLIKDILRVFLFL